MSESYRSIAFLKDIDSIASFIHRVIATKKLKHYIIYGQVVYLINKITHRPRDQQIRIEIKIINGLTVILLNKSNSSIIENMKKRNNKNTKQNEWYMTRTGNHQYAIA